MDGATTLTHGEASASPAGPSSHEILALLPTSLPLIRFLASYKFKRACAQLLFPAWRGFVPILNGYRSQSVVWQSSTAQKLPPMQSTQFRRMALTFPLPFSRSLNSAHGFWVAMTISPPQSLMILVSELFTHLWQKCRIASPDVMCSAIVDPP